MAEKNENTPESMLNSFEKVNMPMNSSISQDGVQRVVDVEKSSEDDNKKNEAIEEPEKDKKTDGFNKGDEDTFKSLYEQLEADPEKSQAGGEIDPEKLKTEDAECEEQRVSPDKLELVRPYIIDSKSVRKVEAKKKETGVGRIKEVPNIRKTGNGGDDGERKQNLPEQLKADESKSTRIWIISVVVLLLVCTAQIITIYKLSLQIQSHDPEMQRLSKLVENLTVELESQNATFIKDLEIQNATFTERLESQEATFVKERNHLKTRNEELVETSRGLNKDIKYLKKSYKELEVTNTDLNGQLKAERRRVEHLQSVQLILHERLNTSEKENQKCQLRLSANFEAVVRDDNDKITKVTDDSPIKIAEQFKETYDNEYTYAFDEMEEMGLNAGIETSTKLMLDILEDANDLCRHYSFGHLKSIRESITNLHVEAPINHEKEKYSQVDDSYGGRMEGVTHMVKVSSADKLTTLEYSQILEMRKIAAYKMEDQLMKVLADVIVSKYGIEPETRPAMMKYIEKCLELCWMMTMNKPPVYIKFIKPSETELFDNTIFRTFLTTGKHLNYIVWPPVYLHEAGDLISKGIAEGKH